MEVKRGDKMFLTYTIELVDIEAADSIDTKERPCYFQYWTSISVLQQDHHGNVHILNEPRAIVIDDFGKIELVDVTFLRKAIDEE